MSEDGPGDAAARALEGEARRAGLKVADVDALPVVKVSLDLNRTAREFGEVCAKLDLFRLNGELVYFDHDGAQAGMEPKVFRSWINEKVIVCRRWDKESGEAVPDCLSRDEAGVILAAGSFQRAVRQVERINRVRLPVVRDGKLRLLPWGYDEGERVYTVPGGLDYDQEVPVEVAKGWFQRYFGSFPYYDDRSKSVQLAALLAPYVRHLIPAGALRKGFLWKANKSDSGKSIAAKSCLYPVMGRAAAAKMKKGEELDKEIEAFLRSAASYIFLDNVYGGVQSATLDQLVTSKTLTFRGMGGHGVVTVSFDGLLFVTGNNLEGNEDAARRFLLVDLFAEGDPAERVVESPLDDDLMESDEWRGEALGCLWALVRHWDAASRPAGTTVDRTFAAFTRVLGGIVEAAGYVDPIVPPRAEEAMTPDQSDFIELLRRLVVEMGEDQEAERVWTLEDLARLARGADIFVGMVGNAEQGKKLTIKEDGLKGEERQYARDEGYLTPSMRGKWNAFLKKQVGDQFRVGERSVQFGSRDQRRKTAYTISLLG